MLAPGGDCAAPAQLVSCSKMGCFLTRRCEFNRPPIVRATATTAAPLIMDSSRLSETRALNTRSIEKRITLCISYVRVYLRGMMGCGVRGNDSFRVHKI